MNDELNSFIFSSSVNALRDTTSMSQTNRRQMERLQRQLATNEHQFQIVSKQIDAQWSAHEQHVRQTQRAQMHIPQLENVYMTMSKQRDILNAQKQRIAYIKSKIGYRSTAALATPKGKQLQHDISTSGHSTSVNNSNTMNTLSDSIFSMSLCDQVQLETEQRMSGDKMNALRQLLRTREHITVVRPQRPQRKGLCSEVVLERKIAQEKQQQHRQKVTVPAPAPFTPVHGTHAKPIAPTAVAATASAPNFSFSRAPEKATAAAQPPFGAAFSMPPQSKPSASVAATQQPPPHSIAGTAFGTAPMAKPAPSFGGFKAPDSSALSFGTPNASTSGRPSTSVPPQPITFGAPTAFSASNPGSTVPKAPFSEAPSFVNATYAAAEAAPKPLTPTLNALLPKGIAAAAAAAAPAPAKPAIFAPDKENHKPNDAPLALTNKTSANTGAAKPTSAAVTVASLFGGATTITPSISGGAPHFSGFGSGSSSFGAALPAPATATIAPSTTIIAVPKPTVTTAASSATTPSSTAAQPVNDTSAPTTANTSSSTTASFAPAAFSFGSGTETVKAPTPRTAVTSSTSFAPAAFSFGAGTEPKHTNAQTPAKETQKPADSTDTLFQGLNVCSPIQKSTGI